MKPPFKIFIFRGGSLEGDGKFNDSMMSKPTCGYPLRCLRCPGHDKHVDLYLLRFFTDRSGIPTVMKHCLCADSP